MADQTQTVETLSKRETEVAAAYANGDSYKVIARDLGISPTTVRSHLRTVYGKLKVTSKIALAQSLADPTPVASEDRDEIGLTADLALELDDAMRRERMMARVLSIISQQGAQLSDVIDEVLDHALEICEAEFGLLFEFKGEMQACKLQSRNVSPAFETWLNEQGVFDLDPVTAIGRMATTKQTVSITDVRGDDIYESNSPLRIATADLGKARSFAAIPMLSGNRLIGAFTVYRTRVHPFNDRALELAQAFADQAAIAIENARQKGEMETRLSLAAATREILDGISNTRDDEAPVFDTILRNAATLCNSPMARLELADNSRETFRCVAAWGEEQLSFKIGEIMPLNLPNDLPTAIREGVLRHIHDLSKTELYLSGDPIRVRMVDDEGYRTYLVVPLISGGVSIGAIVLCRREVAPFSDEQIALVETFAAQAVIALENVRQFRELEARLQRAQSTRDILDLISDSRADEQPVFEAITQSAVQLCHAQFCMLWRYDGNLAHYCASFGFTSEFMAEYLVDFPAQPEPNGIVFDVIEAGTTVHLKNAQAEPYCDAAVARQLGYDYMVAIPINTNDGIWGVLVLGWPKDLLPDTNQIELLETFAAQGAIAIENARQFKALQARLGQTAATRDILKIISQSRDDELPVFNAILKKASKLCSAPLAYLSVANEERTQVTVPAQTGARPQFVEDLKNLSVPMDSPLALAKSIADGKVIRFDDIADDDLYRQREPNRVAMVENEGAHSVLVVPLLSNGLGIGAITLYRREVAPFSDDDVSLVEGFAAQAVIAIENVRQFKELENLNAELGERVQEQVAEIERMGLLKRFLPAAVADTVISSGSETMLKSHRALLGVLFCDIRGFTAFCESAEPEETIEVLQTYHQELGKLINDHGAGVDHRMGDGIMVLFNDPLPCDDPAGEAVRLAVAMQAKMVELCKNWKRLGHRLGFGVGISLGYATVGMVGHEGRSDYTASGTAVNLAARLCDEAADGEILLSARAGVAVEEEFSVESKGQLNLKGIREPVDVFRLKSDR